MAMARARPSIGPTGALLAAALLLGACRGGAGAAAKPCVDQDERWAAHGSSCVQMARLCKDEGYGSLVRAWCPASCGLCPLEDGPAAAAAPRAPGEGTNDTVLASSEGDANDTALADGGGANDTALASFGDDFVHLQDEGNGTSRGPKTNGTAQNRTSGHLLGPAADDDEEAPKECAAEIVASPSLELAEAGSTSAAEKAGNTSAAENTTESAATEVLVSADVAALGWTSILPKPLWAQTLDNTTTTTTSAAEDEEEQAWGGARRGPRRAAELESAMLDEERNATLSFDNASFDDGTVELEVAWGETRRWSGAELDLAQPGNLADGGNATGGPKVADRLEIKALPRGLISLLGEEERGACPEGFEQLPGEVFGGDQFTATYFNKAATIEACGLSCAQTAGCGSFEYSSEKNRCYRKSQTKITHDVGKKNFVFCRRTPCPRFKTEEACIGPDVPKGYFTAEVSMRPGSYCIWSGGNCQAPMACSDSDCFLPDGGLPGMELPKWQTLWITREGLQATMQPASL